MASESLKYGDRVSIINDLEGGTPSLSSVDPGIGFGLLTSHEAPILVGGQNIWVVEGPDGGAKCTVGEEVYYGQSILFKCQYVNPQGSLYLGVRGDYPISPLPLMQNAVAKVKPEKNRDLSWQIIGESKSAAALTGVVSYDDKVWLQNMGEGVRTAKGGFLDTGKVQSAAGIFPLFTSWHISGAGSSVWRFKKV